MLRRSRTGETSDRPYGKGRDPSPLEKIAERAEAQHLWEEEAKADSAAWRKRVEGDGGRGAAAEKEETQP